MGNLEAGRLTPGLYLVSVPIGNARDITLRALDILASAEVLAAEDTRSLRRLLEIHGVPLGDRPILSYHDHNGDRMRPRLMAELAAGRSLAYASEAGTPMISDPGFDLVRACIEAEMPVTTAPGVSAVVTALTVAGLPTDRFMFAGFLPNASGQRKTQLKALAEVPATLAFYEFPRRVAAMLRDAADVLGDRQAVVCRELTKKFEQCLRGTLSSLAETLSDTNVKGEIVVLVARADSPEVSEGDVTKALESALQTMSVRDAADFVSRMYSLPRRAIYQQAMKMGQSD